jgi:hypothetical protein
MSNRRPRWVHWVLLGIVALSLLLHLWGIRKDLPYIPGVDEPTRVVAALRIVTSGDLNPRTFGHPGSTVIYPLAALYHIRYRLSTLDFFSWPDPELQNLYDTDFSSFYLLGRLLTILYGVLTLPLIYLVGRKVFSEPVGLVGAWLFACYPLAVTHAQMVRTDSAATFFGSLALWLCLRVYCKPSIVNQTLAGSAIGLAISSRYFMVTLVPVLLAVDVLVLARGGRCYNWTPRTLLTAMLLGLVASVVVFLLSTPFFLLDLPTVLQSLRHEARDFQPGADGLSRPGNFLYYLGTAIPGALTWPQTLLALFGVIAATKKRNLPQLLLLGFVLVFLAAISASALHWQRWIIPILPMLALFVAGSLDLLATGLSHRFGPQRAAEAYGIILISGALAVSALPLYELCRSNIRQSNYSTRVWAHEWILSNLPSESRIAKEAFSAPLTAANFLLVTERFYLSKGYRLEDYFIDGYQYLVVSSSIYEHILSAPDRYSAEASFYRDLFARGHLIRKFEPSGDQRPGPTILIYDIRDAAREFFEKLDWASQPTDILIRANAYADADILDTIHKHLLPRLPTNLDVTLVDASNIPRLRVLGYALTPSSSSEKGTELRLYFKALDRMERDYIIVLHGAVEDISLLPPERQQYGFASWEHWPQVPTSQWQPGRIYADVYRIQTKPGEYHLRFGFWEPRTQTLMIVLGSGTPAIELGRHFLR